MFRFKCGSCDNLHEGKPALACQVPDALLRVHPAERAERVRLNSDLAVLDDKQFFIRVCMDTPIQGSDEFFNWGFWVEVSEADFVRYIKADETGETCASFNATLANTLPFYEESRGVPVLVRPQEEGLRPLVEPTDERSDFARQFRTGMPLNTAHAYIALVLHPGTGSASAH